METPNGRSSTPDLTRSKSGDSLHRLLAQPRPGRENRESGGGRGDWRIGSRVKTVGAALLMCLHLGVDPPDLHKTNPAARMNCWVDPLSEPKAKEAIIRNIQAQYEYWHPRARYKTLYDPTQEEMRKLLTGLRKSAGKERILLHYNGHGVPRPTINGEMWCFNRQYTQYIPLTVMDVHNWTAGPALLVLDCSAAGNLFEAYRKLADLGEDLIMLSSCGVDDTLPMAPEMPADLFTCCLTTPMEIAIRWHVYRGGPLLPCNINVNLDAASAIPGRLGDRKTPLGELNWILTAMLDTIAWCVLPRDLFKKLFRQDILVASLFRNFLLSLRILHSFRCTPQSWPLLPSAAILSHPLWGAWDLAVDSILSQVSSSSFDSPSPFFTSQMDAFELWIHHHALSHSLPRTSIHLPVLLQVLLSQTHRNRALQLLGTFLDLGDWAILDALHVGIFPYLIKLFQSPSPEIRYSLLYLWMRILRFDQEVAAIDLIKDDSYNYFARIMTEPSEASIDLYEIKAMAIYCLSLFCSHSGTPSSAAEKLPVTDIVAPSATLQESSNAVLLANNKPLIGALIEAAQEGAPVLGEWSLHLLSLLIPVSSYAVKLFDERLHILGEALLHERTDNRTAAVHCIGQLLASRALNEVLETDIILVCMQAYEDSHPGVRRELVIALSLLAARHINKLALAAYSLWEIHRLNATAVEEEILDNASSISIFPSCESTAPPVIAPGAGDFVRNPSIYTLVWKLILLLSVDPFPEVSIPASNLVDEIHLGFLSLKDSDDDVFRDSINAPVGAPEKSASPCRTEIIFASSHFDPNNYLSDVTGKSRISAGSPAYTRPISPSGQIIIKSSLPLSSNLINTKAAMAIEHQKRRNESMHSHKKSADTILARINKIQIIDSEDIRIWGENNDNDVKNSMDHNVLSLSSNSSFGVVTTLFHPLQEKLISADDGNQISIWDISMRYNISKSDSNGRNRLINRFSLTSDARQSELKITGLACVDWDPIKLLISSNDGIIRLFHRGLDGDDQRMLSAWSVGPLRHPTTHESPTLLMEWNEHQRRLFTLAAGLDLAILDACREQIVQRIPMQADHYATAMTSDKRETPVVTLAFSSGHLRQYDLRLAQP